jgi:hypothetical protein
VRGLVRDLFGSCVYTETVLQLAFTSRIVSFCMDV